MNMASIRAAIGKAAQNFGSGAEKVIDAGQLAANNLSSAGRMASSVVAGIASPVMLGGGAIMIAKSIGQPRREEKLADKAYDRMVNELGIEDNKETRDYFDVVKTYSPLAATNHIVAGTMVKRMQEFGGVDPNLVSSLSNIKRENKGLDAALMASAKAMAEPTALHVGTNDDGEIFTQGYATYKPVGI